MPLMKYAEGQSMESNGERFVLGSTRRLLYGCAFLRRCETMQNDAYYEDDGEL